jgi:phytoene/squalene synthetase
MTMGSTVDGVRPSLHVPDRATLRHLYGECLAEIFAHEQGYRQHLDVLRLLSLRNRTRVVAIGAWVRHCDNIVDAATANHDIAEHEVTTRLREQHAYLDVLESDGNQPLPEVLARLRLLALNDRPLLDSLRAFVDAMERVRQARRFASEAELVAYAEGSFGHPLLAICHALEIRDDDRLRRGVLDAGIAIQLTDLAWDLEEDLAAGQNFVPLTWESAASSPSHSDLLRKRFAALSLDYYAKSNACLERMPTSIALAFAIYCASHRAKSQRLIESSYDELGVRNRVHAALRGLSTWVGVQRRAQHG